MFEPETVFRLRALDTNKAGRFLLSIFQPMPFGVGKNTFLVDKLLTPKQVGGKHYEGILDDGTAVVAFPDTFTFILISRDQYEVISMEEAKKQMAEMDKEETSGVSEVVELPDAGYR